MKALLQRVTSASVRTKNTTIAAIETGLLVLLAIERDDNSSQAESLARKVINYRVFADDVSPMNKSVLDVHGELLVVSQFTLAANTSKGLRASLSNAAAPAQAEQLYQRFIACCRSGGIVVQHGSFGNDMQVALINDGPVTFLLSA